jgi:hypothetical protein
MLKKLCGIVISSTLIATFFAISINGSSLLSQKALAQDNNNKTAAATTNNMTHVTKAGSMMMMENKTTINADTLMTKIRNMGNVTGGNIDHSNSSGANMTNANAASNVMIGNKSH